MEFLRKYIKNEPLLNLIALLIGTFETGLSIGSYLSQYLCNVFLSQTYHEIAERMYRIRKKRNGIMERIKLVLHQLFYMDDILILGTNAKDIHKAMKLITQKAEELGLKIKDNWIVFTTQKVNENKRRVTLHQHMGVQGRLPTAFQDETAYIPPHERHIRKRRHS